MREKKRRREKSEREERGKNKHFFLSICYSVVLYTHTYCSEDVKKFKFTHLDDACFYEFGG